MIFRALNQKINPGNKCDAVLLGTNKPRESCFIFDENDADFESNSNISYQQSFSNKVDDSCNRDLFFNNFNLKLSNPRRFRESSSKTTFNFAKSKSLFKSKFRLNNEFYQLLACEAIYNQKNKATTVVSASKNNNTTKDKTTVQL